MKHLIRIALVALFALSVGCESTKTVLAPSPCVDLLAGGSWRWTGHVHPGGGADFDEQQTFIIADNRYTFVATPVEIAPPLAQGDDRWFESGPYALTGCASPNESYYWFAPDERNFWSFATNERHIPEREVLIQEAFQVRVVQLTPDILLIARGGSSRPQQFERIR